MGPQHPDVGLESRTLGARAVTPRRDKTVRVGDLRLWVHTDQLYVVLDIDLDDSDLVVVHVFGRRCQPDRSRFRGRSCFGISDVQFDPLISHGNDPADV